MENDPFSEIPDGVWIKRGIPILPANHPSLRPKYAADALARLIDRARESKIGYFGRETPVVRQTGISRSTK